MTPLISVVTGTYNRLDHLQKMVESARASFVGRLEFVVVDGGSTDGTLEWCHLQPDVRLIEHGELRGAIPAFNDGFKAATGRYILVANDDIHFVGASITIAFAFLEAHPEIGIGAFYQDRSGKAWHVERMPARTAAGQPTSVIYGQVCLAPRELLLAWGGWGDFGARTYGGDNYLSARCWEDGYQIAAIPEARIHDTTPQDDLRALNNPPQSGNHPDTAAYLAVYPHGPQLPAEFKRREFTPVYRILYAPIFEPGHARQHAQKVGLRRALQRLGLVWEVDYVAGDSILNVARLWQPDLALLQLHDANLFTPEQAAYLRRNCGKIVNWNGDVYDRSGDAHYCATLSQFDLHTVVNGDAVPRYAANGVKARYWQIGYEPTGVGIEPTPETPCHDVIFMGNAYSPERKALGAFLRSLPHNVGIYGSGWPESNGETLYDFAAGCRLYRAAHIAISDSQWSDSAQGFVSNRLFQVLAAGGAVLFQQRFAGMSEMLGLHDGEHLVVWDTHEDLKVKIAAWLTNPDPAIAQRGQREVLRNHSFEARLRELRAMLEAG